MNTASLAGKIIGVVFLLAFGAFWWCLVGFFDYQVGKGVVGQVASTHFASTTGTITQSYVSTHPGSKSTSYRWHLIYTYAVNGQEIAASRYRFDTGTTGGTVSNSNYSEVHGLADAHPVDSTVQVYYDPGDPRLAVLSTGLDGSYVMFALFLTPFNLIGLGFVLGAVSMVRGMFSRAEAGGAQVIRDGFRLRVRLPVFTPVMLGLIVTGLTCFVAIFPLGFIYHFQPPLVLGGAVLVLAYGAGVVVAAMQWSKIATGKDDLVIDEGLRTLQLPMTYGRKECRTVGFSEVSAVDIETITSTDSKGMTHYRYAPTLYLRNGHAKGERLAEWPQRDRAVAFTQWLREQMHLQEGTG